MHDEGRVAISGGSVVFFLARSESQPWPWLSPPHNPTASDRFIWQTLANAHAEHTSHNPLTPPPSSSCACASTSPADHGLDCVVRFRRFHLTHHVARHLVGPISKIDTATAYAKSSRREWKQTGHGSEAQSHRERSNIVQFDCSS